MSRNANTLINQAKKWLDCKASDGSHKKIIDLYNSHKPLARGYKVKYNDSWCATFVSACAIAVGYTDIIPTECSCVKFIELLKKKGIWIEDESITPKPGYLILYDWDDNGVGDNKGNPDHIGIVESVNGTTITIIEGNYNNAVKRRTLKVNGKYIRGYGAPKYDMVEPTKDTTKNDNTGLNTSEKWVGKVTATALNVRTWAGTENPNIKSCPVIYNGAKISVCDTVKDSKGKTWYYAKVDDKHYGFVCGEFIKRI